MPYSEMIDNLASNSFSMICISELTTNAIVIVEEYKNVGLSESECMYVHESICDDK